MTELPEVVRQRLAKQTGGDHPDPDLLTAFAEGALGERERTQVLAHLGACATCREVVSLALPETPAQPAPGPVQSGWLRWPVLRWGAIAAAVVVVAAAVITRETRRAPVTDAFVTIDESAPAKPQAQDKEVRAEAKDNVVAKTKSSAPKPQSRDELMSARKQAGTAVVQNAPAARLESVQPRSAVAGIQQRAMSAGGPSQMAMQQQAMRSEAAPAERQASQGGVVGGTLQQQNELRMAQAGAAPQPTPVPAAPPQSRVQQNVVAADRADAAPAPAASSMEVSAAKSAPMRKAAATRVLPARWRIASDGKLERSLDGGASWRVVLVQDGASFRAVSAIENDVWLGGVAGALYHSTNGGQSWDRVAFPNADITRVEFTDTQHGLVTTASGDAWITADGGRTWSARQR